MKNKIFAILSLISGLSLFYGQKLDFKDKNLEKAVLENFDINKNGSIESLEADRVTNLFLVQKGITSTDDLGFFKNVKMIMLDDNTISNVIIKNMDYLELFSCTGCNPRCRAVPGRCTRSSVVVHRVPTDRRCTRRTHLSSTLRTVQPYGQLIDTASIPFGSASAPAEVGPKFCRDRVELLVIHDGALPAYPALGNIEHSVEPNPAWPAFAVPRARTDCEPVTFTLALAL